LQFKFIARKFYSISVTYLQTFPKNRPHFS